jgi:hypothetical protein
MQINIFNAQTNSQVSMAQKFSWLSQLEIK